MHLRSYQSTHLGLAFSLHTPITKAEPEATALQSNINGDKQHDNSKDVPNIVVCKVRYHTNERIDSGSRTQSYRFNFNVSIPCFRHPFAGEGILQFRYH